MMLISSGQIGPTLGAEGGVSFMLNSRGLQYEVILMVVASAFIAFRAICSFIKNILRTFFVF